MYKGIDISRWQGAVDFNRVKAAGMDFCLIKAGGSDAGFYTDKNFHLNVAGAMEAGLDFGFYYFVGKYCTSSEAGLADAQRFYNIIKGYLPTYPVYIDFEAPNGYNRQGNTNACISFCDYMEKQGYYAGIYASDISGFKDKLYKDQLVRFDKWVAKYSAYEPKMIPSWGIWQYSSKGRVPGIKGNVDLNRSKHNYPNIIKQHHLNGF